MNEPDVDLPRPALLVCTAVVILGLDWAIPVLNYGQPLSGLSAAILIAFFTAQVPLHAAWVVFGPGNLVVRIVGLLPGMLIGMLYLETFEYVKERNLLACEWGALWIITAVVWLGCSIRGIRLERGEIVDEDSSSVQSRQFGLAHMLAATTAAGVAASIVTQAGRPARHLLEPITWLAAGVIALFCILPFPAILLPAHTALTYFALWAPIVLVILVTLFVPGEMAAAVGFALGIVIALEVVVLTAARLDGYRWKRKWGRG